MNFRNSEFSEMARDSSVHCGFFFCHVMTLYCFVFGLFWFATLNCTSVTVSNCYTQLQLQWIAFQSALLHTLPDGSYLVYSNLVQIFLLVNSPRQIPFVTFASAQSQR